MEPVPRALVIGASETAALLHLPVLASLRDSGRLDLVEICDLRLECAAAARKRFGFARFSGDAAAAINRDEIDLVYLFGAAHMHHALGLAALRRGKHLFVEKPIAPTYAEAMELADAAQAANLIAVGGHNRRFLSAFDRIRAEGASAGWSSVEAVFHKAECGRPPPFGAATWLSGNGIHALDALVFMMGGLPEWITAHAGGSRPTPARFTAMMRWPSGAQATLLCNNEAGARREEYSFHAPGESWRVTDAGLTIEPEAGEDFVPLPAAVDGFAAEHEAFLHAVSTGAQPRHAIAALAPSLFLAELIEAGHQGPVRLPPSAAMIASTAPGHGILVASADRMRAALGDVPPNWRLIALEEFEQSSGARPDISAVIFGHGSRPLSDVALERLPNLRIVGVNGLSLKRFGADKLLERGIAVVNASQAYAESVAEFALALAILGRRCAFASNDTMRRGGWGTGLPISGASGAILRLARRAQRLATILGVELQLRRAWRANSRLAGLLTTGAAPGRELSGAVVGLIGWGANASAFTRGLIAAGAAVIVHSDHASPDIIRAEGAHAAPLASVLAADVVSLHRGLTPETRHCIGAPELARLRPGAVLINIARGALVDERALIGRLKQGDIFACLDTFEDEPLPRRHPLRRMQNVFLTSHIAGGSSDMHANAAREIIAKIARHLNGTSVQTVTAQRLATMS